MAIPADACALEGCPDVGVGADREKGNAVGEHAKKSQFAVAGEVHRRIEHRLACAAGCDNGGADGVNERRIRQAAEGEKEGVVDEDACCFLGAKCVCKVRNGSGDLSGVAGKLFKRSGKKLKHYRDDRERKSRGEAAPSANPIAAVYDLQCGPHAACSYIAW